MSRLIAGLGFAPVHMSSGGDVPGANGFDRFQREWTLWILLFVLLLRGRGIVAGMGFAGGRGNGHYLFVESRWIIC